MLHPVVVAFVLNCIACKDFARTDGDADFWEPVDGERSVIGGKRIRERNREIRELIGKNCRRVDQGKVDDGRPLAVIITCRSPRWNPFGVLYVETLLIEPVDEFVSPWGLAGMRERPIYGVCVEVAHEECGYGLVEVGCEDVGDGVVSRFITWNLMVDIDETEGFVADYNVEHH